MKQWDLDICAGKGVIQIPKFGATIPFDDGLPYVNIFDAKESGIKCAIPTVFKRTFEEQNSGKAVFKQLPNVIGYFWTTKPQLVIVAAQLEERQQRILEKIPTTRPFQKAIVAKKEIEQEQDDFEFDRNEGQE